MNVRTMAQRLRGMVSGFGRIEAVAASPIRRLAAVTVLLGSVIGASVSQAAFVDSLADADADAAVFRDIMWASGTGTYTAEFEITMDGWYTASLVDFEYPDAIEDLGLAIVGAPFSEMGKVGETEGSGTFSFLAAPGLYYANIYWDNGSANSRSGSSLGSAAFAERLGLLGAEVVRAQSVPLPPAALLFLSGVLALWSGFRRRLSPQSGTSQAVYA